ncbi:hypothetical protein BJX76DRAFT_118070 [Aspergillus varians]
MPRTKQKTKAENLTRVRNNQRRSRQRKRDYVAELEHRLASIEDTSSREIQRLRSSVDELRQVNERLAALLDFGGVDCGFITPSRLMGTQSESSGLGAISNDLVPFGGSLLGRTENTIPEEISQLDFYKPPPMPPRIINNSLQEPSNLPNALEIAPDPSSLLPPEQGVGDTTLSTEASKEEYKDTTVCAVALELVMKCNAKNLSISELDRLLRCGYRSARFQWEGCRVDNQVLFAVLAEIT